MKNFLLILISMISFGTFFGVVAAHGNLVTTEQATVGPYLIEFEYNNIDHIITGDLDVFMVRLLNPKNLDAIPFDSSYLKIVNSKDSSEVLAGNLTEVPLFGGPGSSLSGIISDAGIYSATVDFYKNSTQIAEAKFDFNVDLPGTLGNPTKTDIILGNIWKLVAKYSYVLVLIIGVIAGMIFNTYLVRKKHHK